jgi:membrane protein DedA with SNARE-associated domain/rhodanese-related sulfurtransferase
MPFALSIFVKYAYLILFVWVLVEQLGVPIPSIPLLLTAGTLSATHKMSAGLALVCVLAACMLSDSMWYLLGRRFGNRVLKLLCRFSLEASTCVTKTENYFVRRGPVTLLFAKFVPGLSTVAAPIAGQTGMSFSRFLLWDLAGSVVWAEVYILAGQFFGDIAKKSTVFFHLLGHFAGVLFVLMVLGLLIYRVVKQRRFIANVRAMRLEPEEVMAMIELAEKAGEPAPFIVDLRHPLDYLPDPRVLPGAVRVGPAELALHSDKIPRDRDVILYCTCPSEETSAKVAMQLHKMGINRVRPLRGGFDGWKLAGFPLMEYVDEAQVAQGDLLQIAPVVAAPEGQLNQPA